MLDATPDADEAERCNRLGVIADGSIAETGTPEQLIERHTSRLVEVTVDDQQAARDELHTMDGVLAVSGIGGSLRVNLAEDGPEIEPLTEALRGRGLQVRDAAEVEPRLMDALLALDARRARESDG